MTTKENGIIGRAMEISGWNMRRGTWDQSTAMAFINRANVDAIGMQNLVSKWHRTMTKTQNEQNEMLTEVFGQDLHN
jgi:hypothetical protein